MDDGDLLRQYAENGSDDAFGQLVERHVNLVYSVALRRVGNPHQAEEVTQAVFIILAKKAAGLRHEKALSSWLFNTTRLAANNFIRSEIRRQRREQEAYMESMIDQSGSHTGERVVLLLDEAVAALREKDRRAIVLRFYEGRNLGEVGAAMGTSEEAAKKRVARALEKLQKYFNKRGVVLTAEKLGTAVSAGAVQAAPAALAMTVKTVAIAKGAAAGVSTLTLVKGTMKTISWLKLKFAMGVGAAVLLTGGVVTVAISQTGSNEHLTPPEIFKRAQNAYASLTSYSDEGQTVALISGMTLTTKFSIKLARPNLYRVEWEQPVTGSFTNTGAVWSDGSGDFVKLTTGNARKEANRQSALSTAAGVSAGASGSVPAAFFNGNWANPFGSSAANKKRGLDEKISDTDCYVLTGESKGRTTTLWIGKEDFLIHQERTVTSAEALKAALDQGEKVTHFRPTNALPEGGVTSTQTHSNIVVNKAFSAGDFAGADPLLIEPGVGVGKVKVGMTEDEVIAALGQPDRKQGEVLIYDKEFGMSVVFNRQKIVGAVFCGGGVVFSGHTTEGLGIGTTREELIQKLGEPTSVEKDAGDPTGEERLDYQTPGLTFAIREGKVFHIVVNLRKRK
jgi:RNA polymerase sigma factor (sigma-70 family)